MVRGRGCGGCSAAVERGRVRWVVGGCGGCSVLVVTGVGFHRYPGVLTTIALHVLSLGVECVAVDIVCLIGHQVVLGAL